MKLLICTHDIDSGGSARSISILIEHLRKIHDITLLTFAPPDESRDIIHKYMEWKIPVLYFPWNWLAVSYESAPFMPRKNPDALAQRAKIAQLKELVMGMDCVCFNSMATTSLASSLPREIPRLLIDREVILRSAVGGLDRVERYLKTQIDYTIAIGPVEHRQLEEMGMPNTIVFNSARQKPAYMPPPPFPVRFGVFSQFTASKGIDNLVLAATIAANTLRKVKGVIHAYGGGHSTSAVEAEIKDYIKTNSLEDVVRIEGWCNNVTQAMTDVHCIVRPDSAASPWGRDVIEAMSIGRPVLATGSEEVFVKPGETGWLVPAKDPEALAREIVRIAVDPEVTLKTGEKAFKFASENFDPERNSARIDAVIRELVERKKQ